MVLFGHLVNTNLEVVGRVVFGVLIGVVWLMNGGMEAEKILSNNVMVDVGNEEVGGFFGGLSAYRLVECVEFA